MQEEYYVDIYFLVAKLYSSYVFKKGLKMLYKCTELQKGYLKKMIEYQNTKRKDLLKTENVVISDGNTDLHFLKTAVQRK